MMFVREYDEEEEQGNQDEEEAEEEEEIFMNYGHEGMPASVLATYGFVDTKAVTFPSTITMKQMTRYEKSYQMGFLDYETVAFRVDTGEYTDVLFDAVMYSIAKHNEGHSNSDDPVIAAAQRDYWDTVISIMERACPQLYGEEKEAGISERDVKLMAMIRETLALTVLDELLVAVIEPFLEWIGSVPPEIDVGLSEMHPHWKTIRQFHEHARGIYEKARDHVRGELEELKKQKQQKEMQE